MPGRIDRSFVRDGGGCLGGGRLERRVVATLLTTITQHLHPGKLYNSTVFIHPASGGGKRRDTRGQWQLQLTDPASGGQRIRKAMTVEVVVL